MANDDESGGEVDLSLVDSQALLDELAKRFDYVIFAGEQDINKDETSFVCNYRGSISVAIGMAERAKQKWLSG